MSRTVLLILLLALIVSTNENFCPLKCVCRKINQREEFKVRCGEKGQIGDIDELDLSHIANEIVQLNLSNNLLETFNPKIQMITLQKLDLSDNKFTILHNNQFINTPNLRRLDLSNNLIKNIDGLAFNKLTNLEKLKLNQNQITSISLGTFKSLVNLKQLDISNNPLNCDCSLLWLLDWSQNESVKLVANPTCNNPSSFRGLLLRKLRVGVDIHCKSPAFPLLDLKPAVNQVVFEGDSLKIDCLAASISDFESPLTTRLQWTYLDSDPKLIFDDVYVEEGFVPSSGLISSSLRFPKLNRNHTGIWSCLLLSLQGNYSKELTIIVISDETEYCPISTTSTNKGAYVWPRTIVNYTAILPCESPNVNLDLSVQKATYFCSEGGNWMNLNTSMCSFTSETTKIFQQFSKVNSSIVESAKHFRNYTTNLRHFKDVMDVVFAVETMENYLRFLTVNQIGGVLMDVVNNLMELPKELLREAEELEGSCSKLVNVTEVLAGVSTTSLLHKPNVAVEIFPIKPHSFTNLKCTWYSDPTKLTDQQFYCVQNTESDLTELPNKIILASITIPETLFDNQKTQPDKILNILIAMYSTNKFFPIVQKRQTKEDIQSPIVGAKLIDQQLKNLTDPIYITLKRSESLATPVWWDSTTKSWKQDGCQFSHDYSDYTTFFCYHFGYYGLLQDLGESEIFYEGAKFKLSHPAIYVGSVILFTSFLFMILTYLFAYQAIQMPKKAKHCLINLWISISLLCFLYVFGIYQTEDVEVCQSVGMLLHYFTLSSLLWICVGVNCMYKRLTKNDIIELQNDDLPLEEPIKKPILGLYFVGWGVATIVCGISGAINIRDYATPNYCFLKLGPPLSALYIPFIILIIFLIFFFLLIKCSLYNIDPNGHLSEGTQATENVDLDLLEPNFPETRSVLTTSSTSSEIEDQEHSPSAQLKSFVIFLILYILLWVSCALATIETNLFLYQNEICSVSFAIFATILSAFNVFFYGVARSDVRREWLRFLKTKQFGFRSRNVSDTVPNLIQVPPTNPDLVTSRSSSRSSKSTVSKVESKSNNVNLIVLHRQQYRTSVIPNIIENPTSAEVFYNPHQSIVARKFFKRQKRHMLKRNNLVTQKIDDNSSVDLFATSSKVNNANIHVENVKKQHKNLNIFSDNSDYETNIEKLVLNAERLRKKNRKKVSPENNMRSVSQQCTLEYSSENISDSILDKSPESVPRVILNPTEEFLKSVQSRSSVSVSDLDDLYQRIKGPKVGCFSDSELRNKMSDAETTV